MPKCKNCGIEISDSQYHDYQQLCPDCIRIIKTVDRSKAKSDMWINLIIAIIFTFASIAGLVVILASGNTFILVFIIIPILVAALNWYFFYKNKEKSQYPHS